MDGPLAQIIALVGHGNNFLSDNNEGALNLWPSNSTFQYVRVLKFARYSNSQALQGTEIARDTVDWFQRLHSEGAKRLWYVAFAWGKQDLPEHQAVAFAGGVPRAIQVDYPRHFEFWYPAWDVGDQNDPEHRIWSVEYKALPLQHSQAITPDLETVRGYLRQNLEAARDFSERGKDAAAPWAAWFTAALRLLEASDPQPPFHVDMLPRYGYSLAARQLLAAATQANVFGGMGSWNDLGFADNVRQAEYVQGTKDLYEAVKMSFVAAVNSYLEKT